MFKGLKTIMQADRTESSYLWQAMSESTVTGTARPAMQSWPWRRVQPSTVSPTLLARRSRQWSRAWWPVTAPRSWGRRTTAGLGSHTRKKWSLSCWFWEQKSVEIRAEKSKSLIRWKRRKKADLVMQLAFWQTCQNAIKCHEITKCLHFGSGSCVRIFF